MQLSGTWSGGVPLFLLTAGLVAPVVLAGLAACSLAFSAGPARGLAIAVAVTVTRVRSTGDWRVTVLVTTGLLLSLLNTFPLTGDDTPGGGHPVLAAPVTLAWVYSS